MIGLLVLLAVLVPVAAAYPWPVSSVVRALHASAPAPWLAIAALSATTSLHPGADALPLLAAAVMVLPGLAPSSVSPRRALLGVIPLPLALAVGTGADPDAVVAGAVFLVAASPWVGGLSSGSLAAAVVGASALVAGRVDLPGDPAWLLTTAGAALLVGSGSWRRGPAHALVLGAGLVASAALVVPMWVARDALDAQVAVAASCSLTGAAALWARRTEAGWTPVGLLPLVPALLGSAGGAELVAVAALVHVVVGRPLALAAALPAVVVVVEHLVVRHEQVPLLLAAAVLATGWVVATAPTTAGSRRAAGTTPSVDLAIAAVVLGVLTLALPGPLTAAAAVPAAYGLSAAVAAAAVLAATVFTAGRTLRHGDGSRSWPDWWARTRALVVEVTPEPTVGPAVRLLVANLMGLALIGLVAFSPAG